MVERGTCVAILFIIVTSILSQVLFRYFIGRPLIWPEELCTFLLVWATFIGASWVMKQQRHAMVESIVKLLPTELRLSVAIVVDLCVIGFLLVILVVSLQLFPLLQDIKTVSLRIPRNYFLLAVIISMASMTLFFLEDIIEQVRKSIHTKQAGEGMAGIGGE